METLLFDPFDFCRRKEERAGTIAIAELSRLAKESADRAGALEWRLSGGTSRLGQPQLTLSVKGLVKLTCQRCLTPFEYEIDSEARLVLAKDEAEADEIQAMLNDDSVEAIVGSGEMDIVALVEDEALLSLPLSPRHEVCPDTSLAERQNKKESPFAVLRSLKKP